MNNTTVPNATEVSELRIFTDNEADLYSRMVMPIVKTMKKRLDAKTYDANLGIRPFLKVVDEAAKRYVAAHCSKGDKYHEVFSLAVRTEVANQMQTYFLDEIKEGNY